MKKNITKFSLLVSGLALAFGLALMGGGTKPIPVSASTTRANFTFYNGSSKVGTATLSLTLSFNTVITNSTKTYDIPIPTEQKGYVFNGYWTEKSGGNQMFTADKKGTGKSMKEDTNLKVYAQWKLINYNISYNNLQGATHTNPSSYAITTSTITLTNPTSIEGYSFLGWYDAEIGGNQVTEIAKGSTGNIDLYAQWSFVGVDTAMKLAYNYVNKPNNNNVFRLMCAVDTEIETYDASEAGIYIEKEISGGKQFAARFDFLNNKVYFPDGTSQSDASIYTEEIKSKDSGNFTVKYILIDLGDLIKNNSSAYATYTIHSYIKENDNLLIGDIKSSYSFASLLNAYLDPTNPYGITGAQRTSLERCKSDLGL